MAGGARTVYIAGAGIAGLTLALSLAKFGASVVVLERNRGIQEAGAGLQLSPNARRVLNQLGLDKQVSAASFEPEGIDLYPFGAARPLTTLKLGATARGKFGVPYAVMHRADLADLLYKACKRFANIEMLFGVHGYDAVSHARDVSVTLEEADGRPRSGRAFAFIGADGVNSTTRTHILGGPAAEQHNRVAWRALLDIGALDGAVALDRTSVLFGPGFHAVCYPLPHRGKLNVALFAKEPPREPGAAAPTDPSLPPAALRSRQFAALLKAAKGQWSYWPLGTVSAEQWHHGGIGLIGDAAHALLPFQAQGAAMAIEDAAILAPLLMTEPRAAAALHRFVALRRARVDQVARISASNGFAFHLDWPFSLGRDLVLQMQGPEGHLRRLAWLYGYDAAPEIDLRAPARPPTASRTEREHRH